MEITTRDPTPTIRVHLGSEAIIATRGHPFWVAGKGWRMAKELELGDRLHCVNGTVAIDGLEELPAAKATDDYFYSFNLVVDDFHTFFVGQSKVLVHDNNLYGFDDTPALVPGLLPP